jgi:hypothetical protein
MVQSHTREDEVWLIDKNGKCVGVLVKDGGMGPDHSVSVTTL